MKNWPNRVSHEFPGDRWMMMASAHCAGIVSTVPAPAPVCLGRQPTSTATGRWQASCSHGLSRKTSAAGPARLGQRAAAEARADAVVARRTIDHVSQPIGFGHHSHPVNEKRAWSRPLVEPQPRGEQNSRPTPLAGRAKLLLFKSRDRLKVVVFDEAVA